MDVQKTVRKEITLDINELKQLAENYCKEAEEHEDKWKPEDRLRIMDFVLYATCMEERG